jgi:hypothetical protein
MCTSTVDDAEALPVQPEIVIGLFHGGQIGDLYVGAVGARAARGSAAAQVQGPAVDEADVLRAGVLDPQVPGAVGGFAGQVDGEGLIDVVGTAAVWLRKV